MICPDPVPAPGLIANHRYLFKVPPDWKRQQIWSEIIGRRTADLIGVEVPTCFVALGPENTIGVLVEFFYGYPDATAAVRFVHGSDLLRKSITNRKLGKPHSVYRNVFLCRHLPVQDAEIWRGKALLFDALIGNTDRHPENWGFLVHRSGSDLHFAMAPVFDNGTSPWIRVARVEDT